MSENEKNNSRPVSVPNQRPGNGSFGNDPAPPKIRQINESDGIVPTKSTLPPNPPPDFEED